MFGKPDQGQRLAKAKCLMHITVSIFCENVGWTSSDFQLETTNALKLELRESGQYTLPVWSGTDLSSPSQCGQGGENGCSEANDVGFSQINTNLRKKTKIDPSVLIAMPSGHHPNTHSNLRYMTVVTVE